MALEIIKAGVLDTIQDLGRTGSRRFGINPNGAMDSRSLRILNILLGKPENSPAIEMHFPAAEIRFERDTVFALGGADFGAKLDKVRVPLLRTISAKKGQTLRFGERSGGSRVYLATKGRFELSDWLGSLSTNLVAGVGGYHGRPLRKGDVISISGDESAGPGDVDSPNSASRSLMETVRNKCPIRFTAGPARPDLTGRSVLSLRNSAYTIREDSNRMGLRLRGPSLKLLDTSDTISSGVTFGTIQLLPDGNLIILMADHQTTGGYPQLGTVAQVDLPRLAQLNPGDELRLEMIDIRKAEQLFDASERDLSFLKTGVRFNTK